jgi:Ni/Co efflux regulator RcnB
MIGEMRRLISVLAAAALIAGPLATASAAMAKDDHRSERREQQAPRGSAPRWPGGGGRQAAPAYRGGQEYRYERPEGRNDPRNEPRNDPRMNGYRSEAAPDPRYDPRAYGPPAPSPYASAPRRGSYVGPGSGGAVIQDPGRYRLRPPPRGYVWMHTPSGMAMVSQSTGQIYDMVPYPPY